MLPWILLGSAALGYLKSKEDEKAYKQQMKVESTKERWSSFTGQHGQNLKKPNKLDPIMQSMMAGGMMASQFQGAGGGDASGAGANPYAGQTQNVAADPSAGPLPGLGGGDPAAGPGWSGQGATQPNVMASYPYPYQQPGNLYAMGPK